MNELTVPIPSTDLEVRARPVARYWADEPDGPNDRPIEIWISGNWVPAYFSDLRAGDFFLDLKANLDPGRCFRATSNVTRSVYLGVASFVVKGMEIVQAPALAEVVLETLPAPTLLALPDPNQKELDEP